MAEYARLFDHALPASERTSDAAIWRFTSHAGVEPWVRDLAAREAACCPFLTYTVTADHAEVTYQITGDSRPTIKTILDEIHHLPHHSTDGLHGLLQRLDTAGMQLHTSDDTTTVTS